MLASIKDVLIISTPEILPFLSVSLVPAKNSACALPTKYRRHRGDLRTRFILGEEFIGDDSVCLILGDNVFYGQD
jgi:glucose-1-phosphate thymidylyltransferase